MSTKLRAIPGLAIGLLLLPPLVVPIHAQAASPALDFDVMEDSNRDAGRPSQRPDQPATT